MKIALTNRQTQYRADPAGIRELCQFLRPKIEAIAPGFTLSSLSILWVGDDEIQTLNQAFFSRNQVTDVISFSYPPIPGMHGHTGELMINLHQAWHEGNLRSGPDYELARYIAHGMHHLTGATDETPALRKQMHTREAAWVRDAIRSGLVQGLLRPKTQGKRHRA